jgi:molybdopterin/thiamine biosynthesis adenylyltransferase
VIPGFNPLLSMQLAPLHHGGLGSPAALYLAAAGVGRLSLADADTVELSNLHRQIIHGEAREGVKKAVSGAASCGALNGGCVVTTHLDGITQRNALALVGQHDIVLDCTDNVETRYLLSGRVGTFHVILQSNQ